MKPGPKAAARSGALVAIGMATLAVGAAAGLRWNGTESAPAGLWRVEKQAARRGDWVSFCPPDTALFREYRDRGYIHGGPCPGGLERLLKSVVALAGDVVTVAADGVSVNGARLPDTAPQTQDGRGRPLLPGLIAAAVVEPGELWVLSSHSPLSIDSRYFGPIATRSIEGVAAPVWVGE